MGELHPQVVLDDALGGADRVASSRRPSKAALLLGDRKDSAVLREIVQMVGPEVGLRRGRSCRWYTFASYYSYIENRSVLHLHILRGGTWRYLRDQFAHVGPTTDRN